VSKGRLRRPTVASAAYGGMTRQLTLRRTTATAAQVSSSGQMLNVHLSAKNTSVNLIPSPNVGARVTCEAGASISFMEKTQHLGTKLVCVTRRKSQRTTVGRKDTKGIRTTSTGFSPNPFQQCAAIALDRQPTGNLDSGPLSMSLSASTTAIATLAAAVGSCRMRQ
jgi:hypothetical protein